MADWAKLLPFDRLGKFLTVLGLLLVIVPTIGAGYLLLSVQQQTIEVTRLLEIVKAEDYADIKRLDALKIDYGFLEQDQQLLLSILKKDHLSTRDMKIAGTAVVDQRSRAQQFNEKATAIFLAWDKRDAELASRSYALTTQVVIVKFTLAGSSAVSILGLLITLGGFRRWHKDENGSRHTNGK